MKPYNCNCIYISQVSELKAQKEELLNFIEKYQKEMFSENGCLTGQDWQLFQDIIQKYKSNE